MATDKKKNTIIVPPSGKQPRNPFVEQIHGRNRTHTDRKKEADRDRCRGRVRGDE